MATRVRISPGEFLVSAPGFNVSARADKLLMDLGARQGQIVESGQVALNANQNATVGIGPYQQVPDVFCIVRQAGAECVQPFSYYMPNAKFYADYTGLIVTPTVNQITFSAFWPGPSFFGDSVPKPTHVTYFIFRRGRVS